MRRYRLCGITIESSLVLPELPAASGAPEYVFARSRKPPAHRRPRWYHHWQEPEGRKVLLLGRVDTGYLLRFPHFADFEISADVSRISAQPRNGLPPETLRHLLLDQVWPLALSGRGHLVLHASAVAVPRLGAVAFAGPAGSGKSSLAAAFAAAGARILTDDCLLVQQRRGRWYAVPSYPGLRLWPDMLPDSQRGKRVLADVAHYTGKKRLDARALPFASASAPLAGIYIVRPRGIRATLAITDIGRVAAIMELVSLSYLLDHQDRGQLAGSFTRLAGLAASTPVMRLELPHAPGRLRDAVALTVAALRDRTTA